MIYLPILNVLLLDLIMIWICTYMFYLLKVGSHVIFMYIVHCVVAY